MTPIVDNAGRADFTRHDEELRDENARLRAELAGVRLDSLSALARGISDDLDRILRPIEMSIGVLDEQLPGAESRRALGVLQDSIARGTSLAQQLRTFGAGLDPSIPAIDVEAVLADLRRVVASTFPRSIELVVETAAGIDEVTGSSARLGELLLNLCLDARDAMPTGGRLLLRAEPVTMDETAAASVRGAHPGRYVAISVTDSGSRAPGGPVRIHDPYPGVLSVHTDARGTIARVFVPVAANGGEQLSLPPAMRGHGELILLVGFDAAVQSIASHVLVAHGYRVTATTTAAGAVVAFANHNVPVAAALVDLPSEDVEDGVAMIRALQAVSPAVKIIAATALDVTTASFDGTGEVKAFLPKPLHTEGLLFVLRRVLDP